MTEVKQKITTSSTLSHHVWNKNLGPEPNLKWDILAKAPSYRKGNRNCDLCLTEKLYILKNLHNQEYLNRRTEMALRCRHKANFRLSAFMKERKKQK